jgi:signal transduction histidine kinase
MSNVRDHETAASVVDAYAHLLSLAAHEFRTPASVVGGYLRMLQRDSESPLTERQLKMVDEAFKACTRLVALVAELSEVGKLDNNSAPVKTETFDLFTDLTDVASNVHAGEDREVHLQLSGMSAGARITGDRTRLTSAFDALFRAVLREQPTAVTMVADRRLVTSEHTTAAIVVIARETDLQRAYDAVARPFDEHRGGVGLSLPIARRVVERAGGRVWAPTPVDDDDRGLRSAVVVSIPLPE